MKRPMNVQSLVQGQRVGVCRKATVQSCVCPSNLSHHCPRKYCFSVRSKERDPKGRVSSVPPSFSLFLLQTHWGFLVTWASPMNLQKNDPRKGPSWTECGKSKVEYMGITCDLVHVVEEALSFQFVLAASRMHQTRLLGPLLPPSMCWMVSIFWALWLSSDELVFPETCDPERIPHVLHYEWGEELRDKSRHRGMNIPIQREQR